MLRLTSPSLVVFQNPTLPRVLTKFTPDKMELLLIAIKERKKKMRYLGGAFQHYGDRWGMYAAMGNVRKGSRFILERHHTRAQYVHPGTHRNKVDIRSIKMTGAQFDSMANTTRSTWDHEVCSTNMLSDPTFRRLFRDMPKNEALAMMEEWGVRYVVLDEIRKPSLVDCKYHKHQIYSNKFSWAPDPETNYFRGDAEFKWKGDELIAYPDYNAHVQHPSNFAAPSSPAAKKTGTKPSPWFARAMAARSASTAAKPKASQSGAAAAAK